MFGFKRGSGNSIARCAWAVLIGVAIGSIVNIGVIVIGGVVAPPPEGVDMTDMEGLRASIHLFEPRHFFVPFLAHALGAFFGALSTAFFANRRNVESAIVVGLIFLVGGIVNAILLPSPVWFDCVDLIGAYLPWAFLAGKIATMAK